MSKFTSLVFELPILHRKEVGLNLQRVLFGAGNTWCTGGSALLDREFQYLVVQPDGRMYWTEEYSTYQAALNRGCVEKGPLSWLAENQPEQQPGPPPELVEESVEESPKTPMFTNIVFKLPKENRVIMAISIYDILLNCSNREALYNIVDHVDAEYIFVNTSGTICNGKQEGGHGRLLRGGYTDQDPQQFIEKNVHEVIGGEHPLTQTPKFPEGCSKPGFHNGDYGTVCEPIKQEGVHIHKGKTYYYKREDNILTLYGCDSKYMWPGTESLEVIFKALEPSLLHKLLNGGCTVMPKSKPVLTNTGLTTKTWPTNQTTGLSAWGRI